jgi:propanol-preferring alcohol dehydrogenase
MRAARLHEAGKPLRIDEVTVPRPSAPGELLVRIQGSGFCHSDVHLIGGEVPIARLPMTLGHENAGTVAAVAEGVRNFKEGDRVVIYGGWGDGVCDSCVAGDENICDNLAWPGVFGGDGGYAEYLLVPRERYLIKLDKLEPKVAAPYTDAALTPYHAIYRALDVLTPDRAALVIGTGGLGQFAVKILRLICGAEVIAADVADDKLATARSIGAHHVVNSRDKDALERVLALSRGGVAATFDFVGIDSTLALAFGATRKQGRVVQVGLGGGTAKLQVMTSWKPEVAYSYSWWGNIKELREVIALAEDGRLPPVPLEFEPLDRIGEAYERVRGGKAKGRIVITP